MEFRLQSDPRFSDRVLNLLKHHVTICHNMSQLHPTKSCALGIHCAITSTSWRIIPGPKASSARRTSVPVNKTCLADFMVDTNLCEQSLLVVCKPKYKQPPILEMVGKNHPYMLGLWHCVYQIHIFTSGVNGLIHGYRSPFAANKVTASDIRNLGISWRFNGDQMRMYAWGNVIMGLPSLSLSTSLQCVYIHIYIYVYIYRGTNIHFSICMA